MHRRRALAALTAAAALTTTALVAGAPTTEAVGPPPAPADPADRVVIVLFDQMLPQYADQFDMPNFRKLRDSGTNFKKAYLGYMASETVMAHNVITSGLEPRHMGWTDEAYRDHANVFGKGVDEMHITGDLSLADFVAIEKNGGIAYPKLADYLHEARPGTKFITVGQKNYAVRTATGATGDIGVHMSGRKSPYSATNPTGCSNVYLPGTTTAGQYRQPDGKNVPGYLLAVDQDDPTLCGRFYISSSSGTDYGTKAAFPSWLYPTDGNRYVPGTDPDHLGGDNWVADAAIAMMENENWSGMFVTMGAIDKNGHMWGAQADDKRQDCTTPAGMTHVECAAENADVQLGKILDAVKAKDASDGGHTLVVLTADHGATYGKNFYGKRTSDAGNSNWYYAPPDLGVWDAGTGATKKDFTTYSDPSPDIAALNADGNVQFSYQSTAIEAWLLDRSPQAMQDKADQMLDMPGVTASYYKNAAGDAFVLRGRNSMTNAEKSWWQAHGQEIVDTMAADDGPDVIGLLHDKTSYGVYGDHGGAQESVQRVPMVFWGAGVDQARSVGSFRTPDVLPTILEAMGITPTSATDGIAHPLGN
jgi:hypothetical protein